MRADVGIAAENAVLASYCYHPTIVDRAVSATPKSDVATILLFRLVQRTSEVLTSEDIE